jgi:hypothetical protein
MRWCSQTFSVRFMGNHGLEGSFPPNGDNGQKFRAKFFRCIRPHQERKVIQHCRIGKKKDTTRSQVFPSCMTASMVRVWSITCRFIAILALTNSSTALATTPEKIPNSQYHDWIPSPYPVAFQVDFVTNISNTNTEQTPLQRFRFAINGTLYYDWTQWAQRIDHEAGSFECVQFYQTQGECSLLFLREGMYRIFPDKNVPTTSSTSTRHSNIDCCLDLPNIGAPPPDWASRVPSTYKGWVWDDIGKVLAKEWWFENVYSMADESWPAYPHFGSDNNVTLPFHTTRQVAVGQDIPEGLPVVFTFPGRAEGRQDMHYLLHTVKTGLPTNSSLFELPKGCRNRRCPSLRIQ